MLLIQILGLVVFLALIIYTALFMSKGKISWEEGMLWIIIWLFLLIVVVIPSITTDLARFLGISRGVDLVIYLSILLLLIFDFYLIARIEYLETQLTKLVKEIALRDIKKKKKK